MPVPTPTDWMQDPEQVERFSERMRAAHLPRRHFLALVGALGAAAALAACGTTAPAATTVAPSTAPSTAPSSAPSVAPSTAASTAPTAVASTAVASTATRPAAAAATVTARASTSAATPSAATGASAPITLSDWPAKIPTPTDMAGDQIFNTSVPDDPSSFDFNKDLYAAGSAAIWQGLLRYDPDFQLCAADAESYEVRNGGALYIFKISPKAHFNNGDPVTAQTYIDSWARQIDPATAAAYAGFLLDIKNAESFNSGKGAKAADLGLRAIDARTLEVTLERPAGYFPILAAYTAAVPSHAPSIQKFGDKWTEPNVTGAPIVSNGPWILTKWERGKQFTLERYDKYETAPKPLLKSMVFQILANSAGLSPYEGGNLDFRNFTGIPAGELPRLLADPQLKTQMNRHSQSGLWYLVPEVDKPPFDGPNGLKVRQAIQKAINREQLTKVIQGLGEPAYSLMAPDLPYFIDPAKYPDFKTKVDFNADAAKKLLDGTPYAGGKGFPKITMSMRDEGAVSRAAAEFIQKSLKDNLGMDIELDIKPSTAFNAPMFARQYQLIFIRWYQDYPDPNNFYKECFFSRKASGKRQAWSDSTYDDLVLKAAAEADKEKRAQFYREAEGMLLDQGVYTPLYYGYAYALLKSRLSGLPKTAAGVPQPNWNIFTDMYRTLYTKQ